MPVIQKAQVYGDDAEAALHRLKLTFDSMNLPPAVQARVKTEMARAWDALRVAQAALLTAVDGCRGADAVTVFEDFIKVWNGLELILGEHSEQLQSSGDLSSFAPAIVRKAVSK
jgi:hypothetical protein